MLFTIIIERSIILSSFNRLLGRLNSDLIDSMSVRGMNIKKNSNKIFDINNIYLNLKALDQLFSIGSLYRLM